MTGAATESMVLPLGATREDFSLAAVLRLTSGFKIPGVGFSGGSAEARSGIVSFPPLVLVFETSFFVDVVTFNGVALKGKTGSSEATTGKLFWCDNSPFVDNRNLSNSLTTESRCSSTMSIFSSDFCSKDGTGMTSVAAEAPSPQDTALGFESFSFVAGIPSFVERGGLGKSASSSFGFFLMGFAFSSTRSIVVVVVVGFFNGAAEASRGFLTASTGTGVGFFNVLVADFSGGGGGDEEEGFFEGSVVSFVGDFFKGSVAAFAGFFFNGSVAAAAAAAAAAERDFSSSCLRFTDDDGMRCLVLSFWIDS